MERKHQIRKTIWITLTVLGLAAVLGIYYSLPVYPAFQREVNTVSEVRSLLAKGVATRDMVVLDPADYKGEAKNLFVDLDGRFRWAKPVGYQLYCQAAEEGEALSWGLTGRLAKEGETLGGTAYRGAELRLTSAVDPVKESCRHVTVEMLWKNCVYSAGGTVQEEDLTDSQREEAETKMTELLYRLMDQILNAK